MEIILETRRLFLRNLALEDVTAIYAYRNDASCYRYQRWEDTSLEGVTQFVRDYAGSVFLSRQEEQHYAICRTEGSMVGDLSCFYTEADRCVTLGITIAPEYHRRGYAHEILDAVVKKVQVRHPDLDIVALIDKENAPSIALFEKLGFYRECYAESIGSYVYVIDGKKGTDTTETLAGTELDRVTLEEF